MDINKKLLKQISEIKAGEGLLMHSEGWFGKLIGYWSHIAISLGGELLREACWPRVKRSNIKKFIEAGYEIKVISIKDASLEEHAKAAIYSGDYTNLKYAPFQLVLIGLVRKLNIKPRFLRKVLLVYNILVNRMICSELFEVAWLDAGRDLTPRIDRAEVMPSDYDPKANPFVKEEFTIGGKSNEDRNP